jgi:hypothetical protein
VNPGAQLVFCCLMFHISASHGILNTEFPTQRKLIAVILMEKSKIPVVGFICLPIGHSGFALIFSLCLEEI